MSEKKPDEVFTLKQLADSVRLLRDADVPKHDDGFYHAHISPEQYWDMVIDHFDDRFTYGDRVLVGEWRRMRSRKRYTSSRHAYEWICKFRGLEPLWW